MGALEDMEFNMLKKNERNYSSYLDFIKSIDKQERSDYSDQVRYAMTISHHLSESTFPHGVLFIGGIGVLGNLVRYCGIGALRRFRSTHDVDVAANSRDMLPIIPQAFDTVDVDVKSNSIENKRFVRGWSTDSSNRELSACEVDVYHPDGNPNKGVSIQDVNLVPEQWFEFNEGKDAATKAYFFGVPIHCASPSSLLEMKLKVDTKGQLPRRQDFEDIVNLLGILEKKAIDPMWVKYRLGHKLTEKLNKVLEYISAHSEIQAPMIISSRESYRRHFLT